MGNKNNVKLMYDYRKIHKLGLVLIIGGGIEILGAVMTGKIHLMVLGVLAIIVSLQKLKPVTKEEMALKSLTIDDNGVSIESEDNTKSIQWRNVKSVEEYMSTTSKQTSQSVEIVTDTNESINFSYKNFIKISKIRKSLKYFCNLNKVEIAVK
jgi:hypothetical protein